MNVLLIKIVIIVFLFAVSSAAFSEVIEKNPRKLKFKIDRQLFPYQSKFILLKNGAKIHYIDEGDGPIILLLHGNPTWSFLYRDIIAALKGDFRLIAPDYPGFGLSYAPEQYNFTAQEQAEAISEFIQRLDLKDIGIMMQDWGGPIGFYVALHNQHRVSRFIIGNTWAWPLERDGIKTFSKIMGGAIGQFGSWCCNGIVRFFMTKGVTNSLSDKELAMYFAPFRKRQARSPTHIFPAQLRDAEIFLNNINSKLRTLSDRPALIVWGLKDFAFKQSELSRFESIFKKHQTVLLENAGHFIQEDEPGRISHAIYGFYNKSNSQVEPR